MLQPVDPALVAGFGFGSDRAIERPSVGHLACPGSLARLCEPWPLHQAQLRLVPLVRLLSW